MYLLVFADFPGTELSTGSVGPLNSSMSPSWPFRHCRSYKSADAQISPCLHPQETFELQVKWVSWWAHWYTQIPYQKRHFEQIKITSYFGCCMFPTCAACCIFNLTSSCSLSGGLWKEGHLPIQAWISRTEHCTAQKTDALNNHLFSTAPIHWMSLWTYF